MPRTIIVEGKTTNEALEKGLKELNVSKNMVEYKQIEDANKRSFYSILAPRVVKLEITVKDENIQEVHKEKRKKIMEEDELKKAEEKIQNFLKSFLPEDIKFETKIENTEIKLEENEKISAYPRLNFTLSTYYKGTGMEEVLKKLEQYIDNADKSENDITVI